jgi:hypothetical protein
LRRDGWAQGTFDDEYTGIAPAARFVLAGGGRRIVLAFEEGYPVAVVFAPKADDVVCFERMTPPSDALVSRDGLSMARTG